MTVITLPRELLRRRSLKVTPLRVAVLALLQKAREPVGAPQIFAATKADGANNVTVYRTLKTLEEAGLVRRVNLRHNHADYELVGDGDHHHLVCVSCDRVEEFDGCGLEPLVKNVLKKSRQFRQVSDHALELFGF